MLDAEAGVADALTAAHIGAAGGRVVDAEGVVIAIIAKSHSVVVGLHCASLSFPDWGLC